MKSLLVKSSKKILGIFRSKGSPNLQVTCAVCLEPLANGDGFYCPKKCGSITCWKCLLKSYDMAGQPGAIQEDTRRIRRGRTGVTRGSRSNSRSSSRSSARWVTRSSRHSRRNRSSMHCARSSMHYGHANARRALHEPVVAVVAEVVCEQQQQGYCEEPEALLARREPRREAQQQPWRSQ